jgi:hypothetical protein
VSAGRTKLQGANLLGEGAAGDNERLDQATLPPPPDGFDDEDYDELPPPPEGDGFFDQDDR